MRVNTRFSVAVHVLALISLNEAHDLISTSESLASSVRTNPVVIRRLLSSLKKAGLVEVSRGVKGMSLNRLPEELSLLDVYRAVRDPCDATVFDLHENPSPLCYVGSHIRDVMHPLLAEVHQAMEDQLSRQTLADVIESLAERHARRGV